MNDNIYKKIFNLETNIKTLSETEIESTILLNDLKELEKEIYEINKELALKTVELKEAQEKNDDYEILTREYNKLFKEAIFDEDE